MEMDKERKICTIEKHQQATVTQVGEEREKAREEILVQPAFTFCH